MSARINPLVLATEWNVSRMSGSGIQGVLLSVYKIVERDTPNEHGYYADTIYQIRDMPFATMEESDQYCLANGWLKEYVSKLKV